MVVTFLLVLSFADSGRPMTVCDVRSSASLVAIRGLGGLSNNGPVLIDYTCPLATANGFILPRSILIDEGGTSQPDPRFSKLRGGEIFQAVIEGEIECREPMSYKRSDDGDIVGGNGFGSLGLFSCRMRNVRIKAMHSLSDEWGLSAPLGR